MSFHEIIQMIKNNKFAKRKEILKNKLLFLTEFTKGDYSWFLFENEQ